MQLKRAGLRVKFTKEATVSAPDIDKLNGLSLFSIEFIVNQIEIQRVFLC